MIKKRGITMANVTFMNAKGSIINLHMRIGTLDTPPEDRGSTNTEMAPNLSIDVQVGDGDVWFCYGNQMISSEENSPLCHASAGDVVRLDGTEVCYVNNQR